MVCLGGSVQKVGYKQYSWFELSEKVLSPVRVVINNLPSDFPLEALKDIIDSIELCLKDCKMHSREDVKNIVAEVFISDWEVPGLYEVVVDLRTEEKDVSEATLLTSDCFLVGKRGEHLPLL